MPELLDVSTEPVKPAQTKAPETEPSAWMPLTDEQRNTAPENIKGLFDAKKWNSVDDVINGYTELEKVLGKGEHIFKPESPDDKEGWDKYYSQIGVPDSLDSYIFEDDEQVPLDANISGKFKEFAKQIHLTPEQAAATVQFQRDIIKEAMAIEAQAEAEANEQLETEKNTIRKALVQKFGGEVAYKDKVIGARKLADDLGIYDTLEKKGLASDLEIISMLVEIQDKISESVIRKGEPPIPEKNPLEELEEIKKSEAFLKRFHPQHKAIMQRFMELNQIIANSGLAPKRIQAG